MHIIKTGFVYNCTVILICVHLNCNLDLCAHVLKTGLHMKGDIQGTDRDITLRDNYTLKEMNSGQTGISH